MATFSWSDTFKIAFQSCLPCLRPNASDNASFQDADSNQHIGTSRIPRARSDELQGLLADPDTDGEAESMSLHSNPGHTQRKIKKKSRRKSKNNPQRKIMSLFGYNLFGRPSIQLADDSEDALYVRRGNTVTPNTYSSSSTTFDSDAAPLDTDAIDALSSPTAAAAVIEAAAQASAEVEARRLWEKEERRRRQQQRKEKKEMKRSAEMLAKQAVGDEGEEFKGFQGSGGGELPFLQKQSAYPGIPTKNFSESGSSSGSGSKPAHGLLSLQREGGDDVVDLDGEIYARNASQGDSNRGSDSRSRTSASMSDGARRLPNSTDPASSTLTEGQSKLGKSRSKSSSSRTSKSRSSATSSQSPSLPSPLETTFAPESQHIVSPSTVERGQGFFDLEDELPARNQESAYFPITGFGGATGGRKASSMGVFLAQRGDKPGR